MSLYVDIEKTLGSFHLKVKLEAADETLALLGASGCGKSLTLKCIAGIETPDKGKILVDDVVLFDSEKKINLTPQQRRTGLMFQNYALFPNMTVLQNIRTGANRETDRKKREAAVTDLLESFGLTELKNRLPHQLSGGQQQRVAIARALINEPKVLLLDEHALFGQTGGQIVMGEGDQGELVAVEAANVDTAVAARLHVQAGNGVGGVVVADAESHAVDDILEKVAGPEYSPFFGEGGQGLEPYGIHSGEFVGTAALLDGEYVGLFIEAKADVASGQTAQKLHEGSAVHACRSFFFHHSRIAAGKLDVHIGRHDGEHVAFRLLHGLKPYRAQIRCSGFAGDDRGGLLETFDDLLFLYGQVHNVFLVVEGYSRDYVPNFRNLFIYQVKEGTSLGTPARAANIQGAASPLEAQFRHCFVSSVSCMCASLFVTFIFSIFFTAYMIVLWSFPPKIRPRDG